MKGAIISPLWFYLINIFDNILQFSFIFMVILIVLLCFKLIFELETLDKYIKKIVIAICVCISLVIFIPSRETMYTIMVANYVTYENIEVATDVIKDSVDYIMDKLGDEE